MTIKSGSPVVQGLDHAAYRCRDAQETTDFYEGILGFPLMGAFAVEEHPTTGEKVKYVHIFFDIGSLDGTGGSYIAFFDVVGDEPHHAFDFKQQWGLDLHFAMKVPNLATLQAWRDRLEKRGVKTELTDHHSLKSLYFHDPNGYRLEFAAWDRDVRDIMEEASTKAHSALAAWNATKAGAPAGRVGA